MKYRLAINKNKVADFYDVSEIDKRIDASGGIIGPQGERGPRGVTGATGEQGPQGEPGEPGGEPVITAGTTSQYWRGDKTFQALNKSAVGLANVDNTSDASKPISTATQTALNLKSNLSSPSFGGVVAVENSSAAIAYPLELKNPISGTLIAKTGIKFNSHGRLFATILGGQQANGTFANGTLGIYTAVGDAIPVTPQILVQGSSGNVGIGTESPTSRLQVIGLPVYANNAAAITGGLTVGAFYRTGADPDLVCVVH